MKVDDEEIMNRTIILIVKDEIIDPQYPDKNLRVERKMCLDGKDYIPAGVGQSTLDRLYNEASEQIAKLKGER